jgi:hypothetical protein
MLPIVLFSCLGMSWQWLKNIPYEEKASGSGGTPIKIYTQGNFGFYSDDGGPANPNNATALAAEKTNISVRAMYKLRVRIQTSASSAPSATFTLYSSKDGGAYSSVGIGAPIYPNAWNDVTIVGSSKFSNGAATTQRLTNGPGTWVACQAMNSANTTNSVSMTGRFTSCEWNIMFGVSAVGHYFDFEAYENGSSINTTYTWIPRATVTSMNYLDSVLLDNAYKVNGITLPNILKINGGYK